MFPLLLPGALFADRFVIELQAGCGGMSTVYRAADSHTGKTVALKLVQASPAEPSDHRFSREAALLAELQGPGIVAYVAHGIAAGDQQFLAMEWLEGEDLAQRLSQKKPSRAESLALLRCAAQALITAHRRGVVHRDIKPSNLFLRGGRLDDAVLLDFGIAHDSAASRRITAADVLLGTPDYMAPEQVGARAEISPATDIFALGCVLHECLMGQRPFAAPHIPATLGKILFAEPALLEQARHTLSSALAALLGRMLAKDPAQRPPDAAALLAALDGITDAGQTSPGDARLDTRRPFAEQHLVSVVLASSRHLTGEHSALVAPSPARLDSLLALLALRGARAAVLADGSLVATLLPRGGVATDQAALAARCALLIKEQWPEAVVALTTGRGILSEELPIGEAMDRAGQLIAGRERRPESAQILLDEATAGLLGGRFQTVSEGTGARLLLGEEPGVDASRPLLGKPTPCVGREQELATLGLALAASAEEPAARAILVTAAAGLGKSRLLHELLRRVAQRGDDLLVLIGRGDPLGAGSSLLGQALRELCQITGDDDAGARRDKLQRRVTEHLAAAETAPVVELLGELCGVPFPDEDSPRLRAARGDPALMSVQMAQAATAFFMAECAVHPVLLVLEDLHWSDVLTIRLAGDLLRELAEHPWMVLALARPEVKELFPGLWSGRVQEIPLRALGKKASAQLVRQVLGDGTADSVILRVVEQAAGNALFLEELIRAAAEGKRDALPETVLAMLQTRILRLPPDARQVVLAASVLGETFWRGGIRALLPDGEAAGPSLDWLDRLVQVEIIERRPQSRFPDEVEYRFRHALVRDATYGLLLDSDRALAHRRAGEYLEEQGEPDPFVLAEHYHLGHEKERATGHYIRAAERLFERYDLAGAQRCVDAALACGPAGPALIDLRALEASIAFWMHDPVRACTSGMPLLPLLSVGSFRWCKLTGALIIGCAQLGRLPDLLELGRQLLGASPAEPATRGAYVEATAFLVCQLIWLGLRKETAEAIERADAVGAAIAEADPVTRGWMCCGHAFYGHFSGLDPWRARASAEAGTRAFRQVDDRRNQVATVVITGLARAALGDQAGAEETLQESLDLAEANRQPYPISFALMHLATVLATSEDVRRQDRAYDLALGWISPDNPNLLLLGVAHDVLARIAERRGDLEQAELHAQKACEVLTLFPPYRLPALANLGALLLARARPEEARQIATIGMQIVEERGFGGPVEVALRLVLAESWVAGGDAVQGAWLLRDCLHLLRVLAAAAPTQEDRARFLRRVPANARAVALAGSVIGETFLSD